MLTPTQKQTAQSIVNLLKPALFLATMAALP